jgi:hypothetical protein
VTLPPYAVDFRGHPACPCQVKWLPGFETEAHRRGILQGPLPISQIIGGDPRSGGTHLSGGADDTYPLTGIDVPAYVALSRQMGADATWHRWFNWDGHQGVEHVHRVLTGCIHNSAARYQIDKVRAGLNGLSNDFKDDGPRPLWGRSWQQGLAWAREQEDTVTPEDIEATAKRAAELVLNAKVGNDDTTVKQVLNRVKTWLERQ